MNTLFLGDLCTTKKSTESFRQKRMDVLFGDFPGVMKDRDFICLNLEMAVTDSTEGIEKFGPVLGGPKETVDVIKSLGVDLCGLSNNHVFDLGIRGAMDTIRSLEEAGIAYTGFGNNYEDSRRNYILERNGERIAIIAVCEHEYSYALDNRMGSRPYDEYDTMLDIHKARADADRVIVLYHGGKEYCRYPSPRLRKLCRTMAKWGADLVLCQHSHCIGCYEEYEGCHILYGQGNFHFVMSNPDDVWRTSLAVAYDTVSNKVEFIPFCTEDQGIRLAHGEERESIMSAFEIRNRELATDGWLKGWRRFCETVKANYLGCIGDAYTESSTERENALFAHYLDCEAHTDVWRELCKTYNYTNCIDGE